MTLPTPVLDRKRVLFDESAVAADAYYPAYVQHQPWAADCRGMYIGLATLIIANKGAGVSAIDVTLYDSDDGDTWHSWFAFTQATANGETVVDVSTKRAPRRFVRAYVDVTLTGDSVDVRVDLGYAQVGPRGALASGIPFRAT